MRLVIANRLCARRPLLALVLSLRAAAGKSPAQSPTPYAPTSVGGIGSSSISPAFPLKASANNRYLVDQNGAPFLMVGDSPQALIGNLSQSEAEFFMDNRRRYGINALWVNLLCNDGTAAPRRSREVNPGPLPAKKGIPPRPSLPGRPLNLAGLRCAPEHKGDLNMGPLLAAFGPNTALVQRVGNGAQTARSGFLDFSDQRRQICSELIGAALAGRREVACVLDRHRLSVDHSRAGCYHSSAVIGRSLN
jgi:Protein of unknown function (DUF4038)